MHIQIWYNRKTSSMLRINNFVKTEFSFFFSRRMKKYGMTMFSFHSNLSGRSHYTYRFRRFDFCLIVKRIFFYFRVFQRNKNARPSFLHHFLCIFQLIFVSKVILLASFHHFGQLRFHEFVLLIEQLRIFLKISPVFLLFFFFCNCEIAANNTLRPRNKFEIFSRLDVLLTWETSFSICVLSSI